MTQTEHAVAPPFESTLSRRPRKSGLPLLLAPAAALVFALAGTALEPDVANLYSRAVLVGAVLLTGASALVTMRRFSAGDKLFASWAALGAGYLLAGVRHGFRLASLTAGAAMPPRPILDAMMILQNVLVAAALLWFVLAWRSTGLATPLGRAAEIRWMILGAVVALLAGGYPLIQGFGTATNDPAILISTLGDIIGLALIVPLFLPALAMRGGMLMHTWLALAASELAWLGYDVWTAARPALELGVSVGRGVEETFRLLAVACALVATIAQRRALR